MQNLIQNRRLIAGTVLAILVAAAIVLLIAGCKLILTP